MCCDYEMRAPPQFQVLCAVPRIRNVSPPLSVSITNTVSEKGSLGNLSRDKEKGEGSVSGKDLNLSRQ